MPSSGHDPQSDPLDLPECWNSPLMISFDYYFRGTRVCELGTACRCGVNQGLNLVPEQKDRVEK